MIRRSPSGKYVPCSRIRGEGAQQSSSTGEKCLTGRINTDLNYHRKTTSTGNLIPQRISVCRVAAYYTERQHKVNQTSKDWQEKHVQAKKHNMLKNYAEGGLVYERQADDLEMELQRKAPERGNDFRLLIEEEMPAEPNLRMELTLVLPGNEEKNLRAGLRIGMQKWYVVRDIPSFLQSWRKKETLPFQSRFVYEPGWMHFSAENEKILECIDRMVTVRKTGGWSANQGEARLIRIPDSTAEEVLELIRQTRAGFRVMSEEGTFLCCDQIPEAQIPIHAECRMTPRGLQVLCVMPEEIRPLTCSCAFALTAEKVVMVPPAQRPLVRFLTEKGISGRVQMDFPLQDMNYAVGEVLPWLKSRCAVEMSDNLREMLIRKPLESRVYLDRDGRSIVAKVIFQYGDTELNPFAHESAKTVLEKGEKLLLRDGPGEHMILEILANAGFRVTRDNIRLSQENAVFQFLQEGTRKLGEFSQVFLSRDFRKMYVRRPRLHSSLRMDNGNLLMTLDVDDEPTEEILGIMEALSRSREYYRMKNGTFLNLEGMTELREEAEAIREAAERDGARMDRNALVMRGYRAAYLVSMLQESGFHAEADASAMAVEEEIHGRRARTPAPETNLPLREYQQRGYEWLYMLDRLHMGGILADDMGLGKTVQLIALLKSTREAKRCSVIIAPTSLIYNWLSEIRRFAPELSCVVVTGNAPQRERLWEHLRENGDVDVAITSYPLIRRDIEWMRGIRFRFAILDEAQNIKNAGSMAAQAARQLDADTRLALTGTPMENGIGELWSIFDFVLPGYLPPYHTFLRQYQDGMNSEQLRKRIRPFLTRRLKQDVLAELPDKLEIRMTASMTPEQRNVYLAAMERLRPKVRQAMEKHASGKGGMEVLSAITELREICCHPGLILEGYEGGSGKEELLMEMLPGLIREGRRALIFSQFTSMLKKLRERMQREGYQLLYLDGDTPAGERLELTEKFNGGEGQVFLLSLRAGGAGLNLTGADMVIHFDPWWNPAAEDQATDRAHRIGQEKKVDVIRLVMGESIEEKVVELGEKKKALFERLITPGESGLEALTEQEIRSLFD